MLASSDQMPRRLLIRDFLPATSFSYLAEQLEQAGPKLRGLIPIFEQNAEAVIGCVARNGIGFQQFAAKLLLELVDAGLSSCFAPLVETLRFLRAPELRKLLHAWLYDDGAVNAFCVSLAV